jgi:phospholipid/cholesterol/gamma-HCH transport system substrate-binding protein
MARNIEFKVGLFVVVMSLLIASGLGYLAYRKGLFTTMHTFTLSSRSGEDLTVGMPVVFSGFTIGKVSSLELSDCRTVLLQIKIPHEHVKWLRAKSTFTLAKPLIGATRLVVATEDLKSPPLDEDQVYPLVTVADVNEVMRRITPILDRVNLITGDVKTLTARLADPPGEITAILRDAQTISGRLAQKQSLLEMAVSDPQSVASVHASLRGAKEIVAKVDGLLQTAGSLAGKTELQLYGPDGAVPTVVQILRDLLAKLRKLEQTLDNVNKISAAAADSTADIKLLRSQLDGTVEAINKLANDLDRMLPGGKAPEMKLP